MVESNQQKISKFLKSDQVTYKGLEKENLRSDLEGKISNKSFPSNFGVHNFNRYITLDYSEPHLEIVTPPFEQNIDEKLKMWTPMRAYLRAIRKHQNFKGMPERIRWVQPPPLWKI